ncbi:CGNR zinc finger domain-containing protein [Streptantibioticus rubrisoli]|uniref:ABATE domain-containing protein n=1 Tax=Streptantibioticus rubrisoli TaxID=1387313 RepID=A0ABT1P602_9ACTN|nr:ABATE domain-containing protein [Streptantibioticus rubrisoli]MCQ4040807.1 ABATE domain-containing protein [Streptantibioticus rubrisoli]
MRSVKETATGKPVHPAPPPAPGAEQYRALDFANTALALPGGQFLDLLGSPEAAKRWLAERDLAPSDAELHEVCAARLRALRDQLRELLTSRIDARPAPDNALRAVNDALVGAPAVALLRWDPEQGLHRVQAHPTDQIVDHALAVLAADAADLLTGPDAERLAACDSPPCQRYLLRTHARRHWCSVRCGDRARAARAYARRTQGKHPDADSNAAR